MIKLELTDASSLTTHQLQTILYTMAQRKELEKLVLAKASFNEETFEYLIACFTQCPLTYIDITFTTLKDSQQNEIIHAINGHPTLQSFYWSYSLPEKITKHLLNNLSRSVAAKLIDDQPNYSPYLDLAINTHRRINNVRSSSDYLDLVIEPKMRP